MAGHATKQATPASSLCSGEVALLRVRAPMVVTVEEEHADELADLLVAFLEESEEQRRSTKST